MMSDSAKGPMSGYIFQLEKALLLIAQLNNSSDYVTIEEVDDIATHSGDETVLITAQAKHSISNSGSTFGDTSYALWRTLQIWITKLENKILNQNTSFICATNKSIKNTSLLNIIKDKSIDEIYQSINNILNTQKEKYSKFTQEKRKTSININIQLIEFVLSKKEHFETIKNKIEIHQNIDTKTQFLQEIYQFAELVTDERRERIWEEFIGWITTRSRAQWKNGAIAKFTKQSFDNKLNLILSNPSIINAIFRTRERFGELSKEDTQQKRTEIFVKQIEDIGRREEAKERLIQEAIIDFYYFEIELLYIIEKGDYTEDDFNKFSNECHRKWLNYFDSKVIKELSHYTEEEKNSLAIEIFDNIMCNLNIKFNDLISFSTQNKYIQNGTFLKLSNRPQIGWHPDWKEKYGYDETE